MLYFNTNVGATLVSLPCHHSPQRLRARPTYPGLHRGAAGNITGTYGQEGCFARKSSMAPRESASTRSRSIPSPWRPWAPSRHRLGRYPPQVAVRSHEEPETEWLPHSRANGPAMGIRSAIPKGCPSWSGRASLNQTLSIALNTWSIPGGLVPVSAISFAIMSRTVS